jgi:prepilin-type N-terminal cleavage/methylation domain-containing protein
MCTRRHDKAFTLVELLVTLVITAIILSAVATVAYAMSMASQVGQDTARLQARLRQGSLRLTELLRHSPMVCAAVGNELAVWRADDNADDQINLDELVYIERGTALDRLQLRQFDSATNPVLTLSQIQLPATRANLIADYQDSVVMLIPDASAVSLTLDSAPPHTRVVIVSFDTTAESITSHYEITATLRAWAGHLLDDAEEALASDDD